MLCTGTTTKAEVDDAATCDQICEPYNSRPNTDRTACGEYPVVSVMVLKGHMNSLLPKERCAENVDINIDLG